MYAIIRSGGKQYRVQPGQVLEVDRIPSAIEDRVEFSEVLLVHDGTKAMAGTPLVEGARVIARNLGEVKGDKIVVFKYKPKTRYRRTAGHRSRLLRVRVEEIATAAPAPAAIEEAPARRTRARKKAPATPGAGEE